MVPYATSLTKTQATSCSSIQTRPIGTQSPRQLSAALAPLSPKRRVRSTLSHSHFAVVVVSVSVRNPPTYSVPILHHTHTGLYSLCSSCNSSCPIRIAARTRPLLLPFTIHPLYQYQRQAACAITIPHTTTTYSHILFVEEAPAIDFYSIFARLVPFRLASVARWRSGRSWRSWRMGQHLNQTTSQDLVLGKHSCCVSSWRSSIPSRSLRRH